MAQLTTQTVTIRPAYGDDGAALARLAVLDSAAPPAGPLLLVEVDGVLRVAMSLSDGNVIADPFFPTLDLIAVVRKHAAVPARATVRWGRARAARLRFQHG
jgi:hypothetical protein